MKLELTPLERLAINVAKRRAEAAEEEDTTYNVLKANEEKRYTLGVMYAPNVQDAHGEYVDDGTLHDAVIDFMRSGDTRLRLQHQPDVTVGDIVEMMRWPYEVTVQTSRPGATKDAEPITKDVTLPAGTIFMGVIWDENVWPYVKDGTIGGYSMGGRAIRVDGEDVPELDYGKAKYSEADRKKLAAEGKAMPDGSYPIVDVEDLHNAIQAIGRAPNPGAVKAFIIRRAHALGASDVIPQQWLTKDAMTTGDLASVSVDQKKKPKKSPVGR